MVYVRKKADEFSHRPEAVKARVRRRIKKQKRIDDDIQDHLELLGWKPVDEWTWEELQHGKPENPTGGFAGPKPKWITPSIMQEVRKRQKIWAADDLQGYSLDALRVIKDLMDDDERDINGKPMTPASVRLEAAKYVLNQTLGTPTTKVEVEGNVQLQGLLAAVVVNPDGMPSYPGIENVLEAELVEEDDDDE